VNPQLVLTALNSSKSAYASFTLLGNKFFSKYHYKPVRSANEAKKKFTCKIYNKVGFLVDGFLRFIIDFSFRHCCRPLKVELLTQRERKTLQLKDAMCPSRMEKARLRAGSLSR
jgi:hypothetical protein